MKKKLIVSLKGIENENLKEIKEVERAIEKIKRFARNANDLNEYSFVSENAESYGNENKENNLCIAMTVETEGLEDILGNIKTLTEKLKTEIERMDKAIIIGIEKASVTE